MTSNETPQEPQDQKEFTPYVSPRLRSKIGGRYEEDEEEKGPGAMIAVIGLAVVIVVCGGLFLLGQKNSKKAPEGQTAEAAVAAQKASSDSAATADSLAQLAMADSLARAQSTTTTAKPGAGTPASGTTVPKPGETRVPVAKAPEGAAATPAAPVAAAPAQFGIVVGSYLFEDKASEEKARLGSATSLEASVVPKDEGGTTTYQVVLGSFGSRAEAATKGTELLTAGTVTETRVIPLKKH